MNVTEALWSPQNEDANSHMILLVTLNQEELFRLELFCIRGKCEQYTEFGRHLKEAISGT
jgi:hypothetical protein